MLVLTRRPNQAIQIGDRITIALHGIAVLDRPRRERDRRRIPVIMVTGNATDALASQALQSGAQKFLKKTDPSRELLQHAVHEAIRELPRPPLPERRN